MFSLSSYLSTTAVSGIPADVSTNNDPIMKNGIIDIYSTPNHQRILPTFQIRHQGAPNLEAFRQNLTSRYLNLNGQNGIVPVLKLENLPWRKDEKQIDADFVLAGGSVLNALHQSNKFEDAFSSSDLDFFIIGESDEAQRESARRLIEHFEKVAKDNASLQTGVNTSNGSSWSFWPSSSSTSNRAPLPRIEQHVSNSSDSSHSDIWFANKGSVVQIWMKGMTRVIQIIMLPDVKLYSDILNNFDQSCCSFAYDGQSVWSTPSGLEAMQTGVNVSNEERYNRLHHYNVKKSKCNFYARMRKMEARGFETKFKTNDFRNMSVEDERYVGTEEGNKSLNKWPLFESRAHFHNLALLIWLGYTHPTPSAKQVQLMTFREDNRQGQGQRMVPSLRSLMNRTSSTSTTTNIGQKLDEMKL
ncbi:MAG: hypothetical protein Sylvanvirus3_30 [Sylvanvirus sp.]|uniref:Uncharacterized protein n=1 Tax=Sylvanvirus sp. TaxID=2487774 RepID=A0A3G5AHF0_9VIRU|nr:MAG: hypothetical protein Sylvanvirus3_30 [Sylvanvirus sp.]